MKRCTRCGAAKPLDEFRPNAAMRDGRSSWCRSCTVAATRRWRAEHRDALNAARREGPFVKACADCGVSFEAARRHSTRCPACQAERRREADRQRKRRRRGER